MQLITFPNQCIDEYQAVWQHNKLTAMQLSGGALEGDNAIVTAPGCVVARSASAQPLVLNWRTGDEVVLVFPLRSYSLFALGRSHCPEQQLALTHRREVTMITPANSSMLQVFLKRDFLDASLGPARASRFLEGVAGIENGNLVCSRKAEVTEKIAEIFRRLCGNGCRHAPAGCSACMGELVSCLDGYIASARAGTAREAGNHERIAARVIELLLEQPRVDHGLDDICAKAFCSRRTLANAFNRLFGIPPMKFVAIIKLNWFRRDMKQLTSDSELPLLMSSYGYTNQGRLGSEYRKIFGEKPRETLGRWQSARSVRDHRLVSA